MTALARFQAGAFIEAVKPGGPHLWRPARVVKHCTDHYNVSFTGDRTHYKVLLENVRERTITSHPEKSRVSSPFVTEVVDLTLDDSDIMLRNHSVSSHATPIARPVQSRHYAPHDPYLTEQYSSPNNLSRISHGFFYDPHMPPLSPTVPLPDDRFDNRHFEDNRLPFWLSNQRMNHQRQYYRRRFDSGYGLPLPQPFGLNDDYNRRFSGESGYASEYDDGNNSRRHENLPSSGGEDWHNRYTSQDNEDEDWETERSDEITPPLELAAREKIAREQEKLGVDAVLARVSIPRVPRKRLGSTHLRGKPRKKDGVDALNELHSKHYGNQVRNRRGHMTLGVNRIVPPKTTVQEDFAGPKDASAPSVVIESECTASSDDENEIIRRGSRAAIRQRALQRKRRSEQCIVEKPPRKKQFTKEIVASSVPHRVVSSVNLRSGRKMKVHIPKKRLTKRTKKSNGISRIPELQIDVRSTETRGNGRRKGTPRRHAGREPMRILFEVDRATRREHREYQAAFSLRNKVTALSATDGTVHQPAELNLNGLSCVCKDAIAIGLKGAVFECRLCFSSVHVWCSGIPSRVLESLTSARESPDSRLICLICAELIARGAKNIGGRASRSSRWIIPPIVNPLLLVRAGNAQRQHKNSKCIPESRTHPNLEM